MSNVLLNMYTSFKLTRCLVVILNRTFSITGMDILSLLQRSDWMWESPASYPVDTGVPFYLLLCFEITIICVSLSPTNFWMTEPILTKLATHVLSLTSILIEPIEFLNFENCVQNTFLNFYFKAIWLT
jgi:hypothetical protein